MLLTRVHAQHRSGIFTPGARGIVAGTTTLRSLCFSQDATQDEMLMK